MRDKFPDCGKKKGNIPNILDVPVTVEYKQNMPPQQTDLYQWRVQHNIDYFRAVIVH